MRIWKKTPCMISIKKVVIERVGMSIIDKVELVLLEDMVKVHLKRNLK